MSANRFVIDAPSNMIRGPWGDQSRSVLPSLVPQTDPRPELSDQALMVASTNAFPIVARQKRRGDGFGLVAGAATALVLGAVTFMSLSSGRHTVTPASTSLQDAEKKFSDVPVLRLEAPKPLAVPPGEAPAPAQLVTRNVVRTSASTALPTMQVPTSPVLVYDGSAGSALGGSATDRAPAKLADAGQAGNALGDNNSVHTTRLASPSTTVVQGTLIPAVLETAINTDVPGYVRAVVSQDVRSFDGSRILIPRSSRLIGEFKGVTQEGQHRAFLMWTRLVRPDGTSIAIASPAADFTGQAGVGGQVNSHFFSRFGSSILLSVLGGASSIFSGGASAVVVSGGQSAASVAAQHDANRTPTIKVRQGEPIRVFTARDLIFADEGVKG